MMDDKFQSRLEDLRCAVFVYKTLVKRSLGFFETITYEEIDFNVSSDFLIADLSPLAFFNLVEYIDDGGTEAAVVRLYERILPLLSCSHRWIEPATPLNQDGTPITLGLLQGMGHVLVCEFCTAYAKRIPGADLPVVGRSRPHYRDGQ